VADDVIISEGKLQRTSGASAPFAFDGDVNIGGEIKTGVFNHSAPPYGATFEGIEREFIFFPSGAMMSPTATLTFANGVPRLVMANAVTTTVYMVFEIPEWWFPSTIGVYFEWCNDHNASGDVLFSAQVHEYDIGTEGPSTGDLIGSRLTIVPGVPAGLSTTTVVCSVQLGNPIVFTPGPFSNFYTLKIERIADNVADTLEGPIGLICASMTRGQ